ncbi:IS110 family transposase [Rhodococcus sp. WB9]|nr:IS110 family transposase [Rhodococcus sp. WB9]
MPGIGVRTGIKILLEIVDPEQYRSPGHLADYAGRAPRTHRSGISMKGEHQQRVPGPVGRLELGDRAAGGAFGAVEAHRGEPLVHHVRPDSALGGLHQLLDLPEGRSRSSVRGVHARPGRDRCRGARHTGPPSSRRTRPVAPPNAHTGSGRRLPRSPSLPWRTWGSGLLRSVVLRGKPSQRLLHHAHVVITEGAPLRLQGATVGRGAMRLT